MVKKMKLQEFWNFRFSWSNPVESVRIAQALPEDLTPTFLCHYLSISKTTLFRLRNNKGFPTPTGPNPRTVFYSKSEVLIWLLKECGVIGQLENSYKDKTNNIYISLYNDAKDGATKYHMVPDSTTSCHLVPHSSKTDDFVPISEREFLKTLLEHGFNMNFFEGHLDELLPMFTEKQMDGTAIDRICSEVKSRPDLNMAGQDSLLLTYFRNYKGAKKGTRKPRKKAETLSDEFTSIDYGAMIEGLNDYE